MDDPCSIVLAKVHGMKPASLTTLCKQYLSLKSQIDELNATSKPLADEAKAIQLQVLELMQTEKLTLHQKGKVTASLEQKANTVSWAAEFLAACGPEKVTALKLAAGTTTAVKISLQK